MHVYLRLQIKFHLVLTDKIWFFFWQTLICKDDPVKAKKNKTHTV